MKDLKKIQEFFSKPLEENTTDWPKEVPSRHGDIIFRLVKVMPDRAKYELIDAETGKTWEVGGRVYGTVNQLKASAEDTIKPQGGRQSSQFESVTIDEAKVDYDFSERELIKVLRQLKRGASTEIDMIKAFTKALGRDITKDELFSESIDEANVTWSTLHRDNNNERLLKQSKLSPAEYQKAKKIQGFKADNYKWNADEDLYTKVIKEEDSRGRVSVPRFVKDKNNPNFLNVYVDYDLGPGGSSIALGKETMTGQIRRESAAEAMKLAGDVARYLEAKYNLEDIDIQDLENGKVRIFAVSDDFIDMDLNMLGESLNENVSQEVINKVSRFITSMANYYDFSEQDAVYAIMQALRSHKGNFQGLNEIEGKMPTQDQVDRFFELTQNETHYLNSKPVAGQEATFNLMKVEPWDEYDLANWNSLVRKAKAKGKSINEANGFTSESVVEKVIAQLKEEKPGLWANIRAKKARGGKPAHGNSDAHKTAVKAGKKINKLKEEEGVPHYTKDGKEWKGKLHKMPDGSLMSGNPHDKGGSGPNGKSEKLFHKEDLNEIEDNGAEEKSFDAELMAAANGIAATLGKELKAKQGDKEQLDEAVVTSIIAAVLTGNALIGFISKMSKKLAKKFNWKKGEDFAGKVQKWAHDNEVAFQKPIKRVLKFFIKDETKLEATTKAIYAVVIMGMAAGYGAEAVNSLSNASWFQASVASLKTIAKGDEAITTAYPVVKYFIA